MICEAGIVCLQSMC